jgi:fructose-bisphosphate aldolase class I
MHSPLASVARTMVAGGRGILAADESNGTCNARFARLGIPETEEARRSYRALLLAAPGLGAYISGVILYDETFRQSDADGKRLIDIARDGGMYAGIKVDTGVAPLELGAATEKVTGGLDGLARRVEEYVALGAAFAKWRAVITIGDAMPSERCVAVNAHALARYAAICQAGGLVPIVEPEILMDGVHTLERSLTVHDRVLTAVFHECALAGVALDEMVLKPSMVIHGAGATRRAAPRDVAEATLAVLMRRVPSAVAGIAFLSGGQDDIEATVHLNEINDAARASGAPWPLTFSFGRALQQPVLAAWRGSERNVATAQRELLHRAAMNAAAALGKYTADAERGRALVPA